MGRTWDQFKSPPVPTPFISPHEILAPKAPKKFCWVDNGQNNFPPNRRQAVVFPDPLLVLMPKMHFSPIFAEIAVPGHPWAIPEGR